jgi:hypothetical protein
MVSTKRQLMEALVYWIDDLRNQVDYLLVECKRLERERDAAIEDLKYIKDDIRYHLKEALHNFTKAQESLLEIEDFVPEEY